MPTKNFKKWLLQNSNSNSNETSNYSLINLIVNENQKEKNSLWEINIESLHQHSLIKKISSFYHLKSQISYYHLPSMIPVKL